jgi:predicted DNA binding CopG/RHH family protein
MRRQIPKFVSEDEERTFWSNADATEHIDWSSAERITFSNLAPSVRTISLRLPEHLLENIRFLANRNDVPYQTLMKMLLAEKVDEEIAKRTPTRFVTTRKSTKRSFRIAEKKVTG